MRMHIRPVPAHVRETELPLLQHKWYVNDEVHALLSIL